MAVVEGKNDRNFRAAILTSSHTSSKAPSTLHQRNFKTHQSPVILDLCLRKTRSGKSNDYRGAIVPEKLRFQIVFRPRENKKPVFSNSSGLKSVFVKLRFRDGLVWTVSLTVKIKRRFQIPPAVVWVV